METHRGRLIGAGMAIALGASTPPPVRYSWKAKRKTRTTKYPSAAATRALTRCRAAAADRPGAVICNVPARYRCCRGRAGTPTRRRSAQYASVLAGDLGDVLGRRDAIERSHEFG
jgi:hypothetical protein